MGAFDYLVTLLSFVYALALTHLLTSITELVRARDRVRFSWVQALWMTNALLLLLLNWLQQYANRAVHRWTVLNVTITFAFAVLQYFACSFVSPPVPERGPVDLQAFHDREKLTYLTAYALMGVLAPVSNWYEWQLTHQAGLHEFLVQQLPAVPGFAIIALAMFVKQRRVEVTLAALSMGLLAIFGAEGTGDLI